MKLKTKLSIYLAGAISFGFGVGQLLGIYYPDKIRAVIFAVIGLVCISYAGPGVWKKLK